METIPVEETSFTIDFQTMIEIDCDRVMSEQPNYVFCAKFLKWKLILDLVPLLWRLAWRLLTEMLKWSEHGVKTIWFWTLNKRSDATLNGHKVTSSYLSNFWQNDKEIADITTTVVKTARNSRREYYTRIIVCRKKNWKSRTCISI